MHHKKSEKPRPFEQTLPIDAYPINNVHLHVHSENSKETLIVIKHTVKEFKYIKDFQSYRHKDDELIP